MILKLIKWLIKNYVKRHPEYMATGGIYIDEQCDVDIIVNRYYDKYWTRGTKRIEYLSDEVAE